ncbi:MAG: hypothetical protein DHS20C16_21890 [Phycisphaerae bacterium]|nr:MAG: hypothetical protein DHS20C16_21890 [Phycisphaerae bacterium]
MKNTLMSTTAIFFITTASALAALPEDHTATYYIRVDPADEQSDVMFQVDLDLKAVSSESGVVKWEVSTARFAEIDNGVELSSWTKVAPTVTTPDGYWHVAHVDPEKPEADEFTALPTLNGTADADVSGDDLDYELATGALTRAEAAMYSGNVAGMTYEFKKINDPEPVVEGEDEPEEAEVLPSST